MATGLEGVPDARQLELELGDCQPPSREELEVVYDWGCRVLADVTHALYADTQLATEWRQQLAALLTDLPRKTRRPG